MIGCRIKGMALMVITLFLTLNCLYGHSPILPTDLSSSIKRDSVLITGELKSGTKVELNFKGVTYSNIEIKNDTNLIWLKGIKDSLLQSDFQKAYQAEYKSWAPGQYCLAVISAEQKVERCTTIIAKRKDFEPLISFEEDSFRLSAPKIQEGEYVVYSLKSWKEKEHFSGDSLNTLKTRAYAYKSFQKNEAFVVQSQLHMYNGFVISDTLEKKFIPNRTGRKDSLKKAAKQKTKKAFSKLKSEGLQLKDSLQKKELPNWIPKANSGSLNISQALFWKGVNGIASNNTQQINGDFGFEALGIPLKSHLYYFNNGISEFRRFDVGFSLDAQKIKDDLFKAKEALEKHQLEFPTEGLQNPWDTAAFNQMLESQQTELLDLDKHELKLQDSLALMDSEIQQDSSNQGAQDSLRLRQEKIQKELDLLQEKRSIIEGEMDRAKQARLEAQKLDSLHQCKQDVGEGISNQMASADSLKNSGQEQREKLKEYEERYHKMLALYDKFKGFQSFDLGLHTPYLSEYSLAGMAIQGVHTQYDFGKAAMELTTGRTSSSPVFTAVPLNVMAIGGGMDLPKGGRFSSRLTQFSNNQQANYIVEGMLEGLNYKSWEVSIHSAASLNPTRVPASEQSSRPINTANTVLVTEVSKSSKSGLHRISAKHKYIPVGFSTAGNPFLLTDLHGGELGFNNTLFNQKLISVLKLEYNQNNTLKQLLHTTERVQLFSFQQFQLSRNFSLSEMTTLVRTRSVEQQTALNMYDLAIENMESWGKRNVVSKLGYFHQEFKGGLGQKTKLSILKAETSLMGEKAKLRLSAQQTIANEGAPSFTNLNSSYGYTFLKGKMMADVGLGSNFVEHFDPSFNCLASVALNLPKGLSMSIDMQSNSLWVEQQLYSSGGMANIRLNQRW